MLEDDPSHFAYQPETMHRESYFNLETDWALISDAVSTYGLPVVLSSLVLEYVPILELVPCDHSVSSIEKWQGDCIQFRTPLSMRHHGTYNKDHITYMGHHDVCILCGIRTDKKVHCEYDPYSDFVDLFICEPHRYALADAWKVLLENVYYFHKIL
jgi:hypothetical protein